MSDTLAFIFEGGEGARHRESASWEITRGGGGCDRNAHGFDIFRYPVSFVVGTEVRKPFSEFVVVSFPPFSRPPSLFPSDPSMSKRRFRTCGARLPVCESGSCDWIPINPGNYQLLVLALPGTPQYCASCASRLSPSSPRSAFVTEGGGLANKPVEVSQSIIHHVAPVGESHCFFGKKVSHVTSVIHVVAAATNGPHRNHPPQPPPTTTTTPRLLPIAYPKSVPSWKNELTK